MHKVRHTRHGACAPRLFTTVTVTFMSSCGMCLIPLRFLTMPCMIVATAASEHLGSKSLSRMNILVNGTVNDSCRLCQRSSLTDWWGTPWGDAALHCMKFAEGILEGITAIPINPARKKIVSSQLDHVWQPESVIFSFGHFEAVALEVKDHTRGWIDPSKNTHKFVLEHSPVQQQSNHEKPTPT